MSEVTRRGFFAASAGAVVGAPAAAQVAMQEGSNLLNRSLLADGVGQSAYAGKLASPKAAPEGWTLLNKTRRALEQRTQRRVQWRLNGLDPDIGVLRLPRATQIRMQETRDQELLTVFEHIQKQLDEFKW